MVNRPPLPELDWEALPAEEILGALLDLPPERIGLREQVAGVDREHARLRLECEQHVEQDGLLLLEGARERDAAGELLEREPDDALGRPHLDVRRELQRLRCH